MTDLLAEALDSPRDLTDGVATNGVDVIFAQERAAGYMAMPNPDLVDYRDVLKVIDARERSLQNIKTFLASMCFIRGNARSLPAGVLRRGRAKLARLLARHRAHSTIVVELIVKWRERHGLALGGVGGGVRSGSPLVAGSDDGASQAGSHEQMVDSQNQASYYLPAPPNGQPRKAVSATMASAMAIAVKHGPPPAPKQKVIVEADAGEPFLWMGVNYLFKMRQDMKYAPLPTSSDPLLVSWFHFDVDPNFTERTDSFASPSFLTSDGPSDAGNTSEWVEQEWWFDAERLHSPSDLTRIRDAAKVRARALATAQLLTSAAAAARLIASPPHLAASRCRLTSSSFAGHS